MNTIARFAVLAAVSVALAVFALGCKEEAKAPAAKGPAQATIGQAAKPQTDCPVMGGKINKRIYADHEGQRVYFCCAGCVDTFKKEPAKYVKKLVDAGVTLEKAPAAEK